MEKKRETDYFGKERISLLMVRFCIPCVLSLLVSALYNIVDQIFIGNSELSTLGNAATGVVFPIFIIAQGFAWYFGDGTAAYLNIHQGRGDTDDIHKCVGTGISLTLLVSLLLLAVFYPFGRPILMLFGASENTIGYAVEYFSVILGFFPIYMLSNMINAVIRADGSPSRSMASMLSGAIVNIVLDPVFIYVFRFGMRGAAWATVAGQTVSFAVSVVCLLKSKTFRLSPRSLIPDFRVYGEAFRLGLSSLITQMTIVVISLVCNIMLSRYGAQSKYGADIPIAVIGIESKVFTVVVNIVVGIVLGCQPIVGFNMGAKRYDRLKVLYLCILLLTVAVGVCSTLLFEIAPDAVTRLFGKPSNVPNPDDYLEFARKIFRIFLALVTFTCIVKMSSIFFQAVGKPVFALLTSLIRDIVCFIPLVCILPVFFGIEGILFAAPVADLIAMAFTAVLTIVFFAGLRKEKAVSPA